MLLRNGALAGGSTGQLQADRQPLFEEGVTLVFRRWTALLLALEMQWGGKESAQKAQDLYEQTVSWFLNNKGALSLAPACKARRSEALSYHVAFCANYAKSRHSAVYPNHPVIFVERVL